MYIHMTENKRLLVLLAAAAAAAFAVFAHLPIDDFLPVVLPEEDHR